MDSTVKTQKNAVFVEMSGMLATCCHCGKVEQVRILAGMRGMLRDYVCDDCLPAAREKAEAMRREQAKAETHAKFREMASSYAEFAQPIQPELLRNPEAFAAVQRWRPNPANAKPGIVIASPSGWGKTRAIFSLTRSLMCDEGIDCEFIRAADFAADAVSATRDGWLGRLLRPLINTPVLILDDLGKGQRSQSVGEALQSLIEARCNRRLPLVVTTQYNGEALGQLYSSDNPELSAAMTRRLREFCEQIPFCVTKKQ